MRQPAISSRGRCVGWLERGCLTAIALCVAVSPLTAQKNENAMRKRQHNVYAALESAPSAARARKNPMEGHAREAEAGGKLFDQHCADCHGRKAGGTRRGPSLLVEPVEQASPGTLFWILTNGVVWHGMPVWSKLPEPERWQIVTFLESLRSNSKTTTSSGDSGSR